MIAPYPAYRTVHQRWLKLLPQHWTTTRLKYLCDITTGSGDTINAEPEGVYPFIVRSPKFLRAKTFDNEGEAILTVGDGAVGEVFHHIQGGKFLAHQRVYVLKNFRDINSRFLFHYFAALFRLMAQDGSARTTVDSVRRWMLTDMPVALPTVSEQQSIANYLDHEIVRIDTLIDEQQHLIETLYERRQAAVEEAVSTVPTSGARLKHIIQSVRQGWSPQCYAWPTDGVETWAVLKTGAANGGRFRPMENKELPEDEIPRPDSIVTRGDLILSRANTRELVGSAAVVDGDFPRLMLSDKLYAFSLNESRAEARFVAAVLGSRRWRDLIELEATGASQSMLNISQSDIVNLPMPLPPVDEQCSIVAQLDSTTAKIDTLIEETERFIELARERRGSV